MTHRERFAPSPTGPLHLGHAFSAITAWNRAIEAEGEFLLRIEDIDQSRSRPEWEAQIYTDLSWLGLSWSNPVLRQSQRLDIYRSALRTLWDQSLLYPCYCNRKDIKAALAAPQEGAPLIGPDGLVYPGTCKSEPSGALPQNIALRLNMKKATEMVPQIEFIDGTPRIVQTKSLIQTAGDIVLSRKEFSTSYHLSVVIDDAAQDINHVTRGEDLKEATPIHVLLQKLLKLPTPVYHHHRLVRDENGKRLAKRDDAKAIMKFHDEGATPQDIFTMIGATPLARR